jgi:hypothetical protein
MDLLPFAAQARGRHHLSTAKLLRGRHFCALPTGTRRISWPMASKSWEVLSGAGPARSSSTDRFCSGSPSERPSCGGCATWQTFPKTRDSGPVLSSAASCGLSALNRPRSIRPRTPTSGAVPWIWKKPFMATPPGRPGGRMAPLSGTVEKAWRARADQEPIEPDAFERSGSCRKKAAQTAPPEIPADARRPGILDLRNIKLQ